MFVAGTEGVALCCAIYINIICILSMYIYVYMYIYLEREILYAYYVCCLNIFNLIHIYRFIDSECIYSIYIYIDSESFFTHAVFIYFTICKSICTHPYQSHAKNLKSSFMTRNAKVEVAV